MDFLKRIFNLFMSIPLPKSWANAEMEYLPPMPSTDNDSHVPVTVVPPETPVVPQDTTLLWDTPKQAYHSTRVLCDNSGLSVSAKNVICACIYQESEFNNEAVNHNPGSTDWGIVQVNDHYHIGPGKDFPSVKYVLDNPDKAVQWMIDSYNHGRLTMWVSYTSQAYLKWLSTDSPMWLLGK